MNLHFPVKFLWVSQDSVWLLLYEESGVKEEVIQGTPCLEEDLELNVDIENQVHIQGF
jgi:hypothetical protein